MLSRKGGVQLTDDGIDVLLFLWSGSEVLGVEQVSGGESESECFVEVTEMVVDL